MDASTAPVTAGTPRIFRVFVSSTFDDLVAERDALQRGVEVDGCLREGAFARLRRLCESHGTRFQAIDLRWGVSEEAAFDQRTLPLCLAEVDRCRNLSPRPSFLALLGDRYGWRPLPHQLTIPQWEAALSAVDASAAELLRAWYRRDDNQVPAVALLQAREGRYRDPGPWQEVESRLRSALDLVIGKSLSATEQEMRSGILLDAADTASGFAFLRTIDGLPDDAAAAPYVDVTAGVRDTDAALAVSALRTRLREQLGDRVREYTAHWEAGTVTTEHLARLNDDVYAALAGAIERELERLDELDPLEVERQAHDRFASDRCAHLIGRSDLLARITARLHESNQPLVVWGVAGSGKSAVLAEAAGAVGGEQPQPVVICRFVGATPSSALGPALLRGIWAEIDRVYGATHGAAPGDDALLLSRFPEKLQCATAERPLLLCVDGIDQLPAHDPVRRLTWLPDYLSPHVRVAVSTRPGPELDRLRGRLGEDQLVEVPGLSIDDGAALVARWLAVAGRTLQPEQSELVLSAFEASGGLPLHLRLAAEEARLWPSWHCPEALPTNIPSLIEVLFARLAGEEAHGAVLVGRALGLLAASRDGLTEDELLDLLSDDREVMADFVRRSPRSPAIERLPVVVWSRLYADLEPYLAARSADGTVTIGFYHRELADAATRSYLAGDERVARHAQLADYFTRTWHAADGPVPLRVLAELPFHLARAGRLDTATDVLTTGAFVSAKVAAGGHATLLEDIEETERQGGIDPALSLLREALLLSNETLTRDRGELPGQLTGRLGLVNNPRIQRLVADVGATAQRPWLRPLTASLTPPGEPLIRILRGRFDPASAVAFSPDGRLVAGGSYDRDIRVWDLATGIEVAHVVGQRPGGSQAEGAGGDRIDDLRFTAAGLVAASADRCVYLVDLRAGVARMVVRGETDNLYAMAIGEDSVLAAPRSIWGFGATTLQIWDLTGTEPRDVPGLSGTCEHLAVSGEGRAALTLGDHGVVTRWDLARATAAGTWTVTDATVVALSHDGATGAVGTKDGRIQVTDPEGGTTWMLGGHTGPVSALTFIGAELLVSGSGDGTVRLWDLKDGRELRTLQGHGAGVPAVAAAADAQWIVSGGSDGAVHVWDLGREPVALTGRPPRRHQAAVVEAAIGDDGTLAATLASDGSSLRWHLDAGESDPQPPGSDPCLVARRTPVPEQLRAAAERLDTEAPRSAADAIHAVTAVAVSGDGRRAMTASTDNIMVFYRLNVTRDESRVRLWDLVAATRLRVLAFAEQSGVSYSRAGAFRCTALDGTGTFGAAGGDDRTVRVWHLDTGEVVATLTLDAAVTACTMSPDGTVLVAGEASGRVHLLRLELDGWTPTRPDTAAPRPVRLDPQAGERWGGSLRHTGGSLRSDQGWVESVAVSPDGERALVAGADGSVVAWNLVDRRHERFEPVHGDWATAVAFSVDGRFAASASADGSVHLWVPAAHRHTDTLQVPHAGVWSLLGLPDGHRWLIGDGGGGVSVWSPGDDGPPTRIVAHDGAVTALVGLGGTAVASASVDGTLAVSDTATCTRTWHSPAEGPVWALAVVGGDACVPRHCALETWDVMSGHQRWSLDTGHRAAITAIAARPDGKLVITGSVDGEVRVTDADAGKPLGLILRTGWPVNTLAMAPDGVSVLVGGHGGDVHIVSVEDPPTILEESVRSRFTDREWAVVRRLPGIVWGFVAGADGKVDRDEVAQMQPGAQRRLPVSSAAGEAAQALIDDADPEWIPASGATPDPDWARYDGALGLARGLLRRRLSEEEHGEFADVLLASAREVAARSHRLFRHGLSAEAEQALKAMRERL